jgi:hypothetical protein
MNSNPDRQYLDSMSLEVGIHKPTPISPPIRPSTSNVLRASSVPLRHPEFTVGYVYSAEMTQHFSLNGHPEAPARISRIWESIVSAHYHLKMKCLPIRPVQKDEALLVHTEDHWDKVQTIQCEYLARLNCDVDTFRGIYIQLPNKHAYTSASHWFRYD